MPAPAAAPAPPTPRPPAAALAPPTGAPAAAKVASPAPAAKPSGPAAPDFAVKTLDGKTFSLAAVRGKPVVLLFTASGCGECIPELQALTRVEEEYGPRGLEILVLSVDPFDDKETFLVMKQLAGGPTQHWALDADNKVTRAYGVTRLETTVIVDRAGRIAYRDQMATTYDVFKRELDKVLA